MNRTFQDFEIVAQIHDAWEEVGPRLKSFMESSVEIRILQVPYLSVSQLCFWGRSSLKQKFSRIHFSIFLFVLFRHIQDPQWVSKHAVPEFVPLKVLNSPLFRSTIFLVCPNSQWTDYFLWIIHSEGVYYWFYSACWFYFVILCHLSVIIFYILNTYLLCSQVNAHENNKNMKIKLIIITIMMIIIIIM